MIGAECPYPPRVLREYALLADGERGALIGPAGEIAWLCAPRWDSPSVFGTLLSGKGTYAITPTRTHVWGGYYEVGTLIWRSRWITHTGIIESRETLVYPADRDRLVLLRRIVAVEGDAHLRIVLNPRGNYDRDGMRDPHFDGRHWTATVGDLFLRWSGPGTAIAEPNGCLSAELRVPAGAEYELSLELSVRPLSRPVPPAQLWRQTENAWRQAVPDCGSALAPRETRHNHAVLQGLTSATGGMVAAATTSLPESAEEGRNYDYRYVWIRDQCFAGQAAAAAGTTTHLRRLIDYVTARILQYGDRLEPAYCIDGAAVPEPGEFDLPGYPGGSDVVGNQVRTQFQLDSFGEALLLYAAAYEHLDAEDRRAAQLAADTIRNRWTEPDSGIWELDKRAWTHSRLTAASGLQAVSRIDPSFSGWSRLADVIIRDTERNATHSTGRWQRSRRDPGVDGALLLPPLRGGIPVGDPHTTATLAAYTRELTVDGFAYRYRHDERPLGEAEGAFLMCGFLMALSQHQQGCRSEALAWWERTRTACGPPQLFSEEYDITQHQLRGNLPQAFVHALMIEASYRLADCD